MLNNPLVSTVIDWERRLEIDEEKRKNHRYEPYINYLAEPQTSHLPRKERRSIFAIIARLFRPARVQQPVYRRYPQEYCQETQPG